MEIIFGKRKNLFLDKPNEDAILVDKINSIYLIADGVSRDRLNNIYPNPSPSAIISDLFTEFVKNNHYAHVTLKTLFESSIDFIGINNAEFNHYFKPGTVAICIRVKNDDVEWVSIGDCIGLHRTGNLITEFNTRQTQKLRKSNKIFDVETIRKYICNNLAHELSFGVINGNPTGKHFIESGNFKIKQGDKICLLSDGLEMFLDDYMAQLKLFDNSVEEIMDDAEKIEILKNLRSDDKSFIRLEF